MANEKTIELLVSHKELQEIKKALQTHHDVLNDNCLDPFFDENESGLSFDQLRDARVVVSNQIDRLLIVNTLLERIEHHV